MSDNEAGSHAILLTIDMRQLRIDLDVTNPVPVEAIAESFKRAGITHLMCEWSKGKRAGDGFNETLEFRAILPNE